MTRIVMIRHATTTWNENRRLQGRSDIALSVKGHSELSNWRLPKTYENGKWVCSPLLRAVQTARGLGAVDLQCEPCLVEMDWGDWEGCTIDELRLAPWLVRIAKQSTPINAVCHKGVIRALYAWAVNWNLVGKPPIRLDWSSAQIFYLNDNGIPTLEKSNVNLLNNSR